MKLTPLQIIIITHTDKLLIMNIGIFNKKIRIVSSDFMGTLILRLEVYLNHVLKV